MPSYSRINGRKYMGGITREVYPDGTVYNSMPHTDHVMGTTQTMVCARPKGSCIELLMDQDNKAFYLPLNPVELNRVEIKATPLVQSFWCYADGFYLEYSEPAGLARLQWFDGMKEKVPPVPTQRVKDLAYTLALSRVGTGSFMGAVDLGEVNETAKFLKAPFRGLGDIFTGYTKKVEKSFVKKVQQRAATRRSMTTSRGKRWVPHFRSKEYETKWRSELLADSWLEYRYAASPLVLSTVSLAEEATRKAVTMCQRIHSARGANKESKATAFDVNADWISDGVDNMRRSTSVENYEETKVSYVIRYAFRPYMVDAINLARFGISPTQIASTTWELLPLSFVSDWFWNFGQWIKAMEPKPQLRIIDIAYTHTYVHECYVRDRGGAYSYYSRLPKVDAEAHFSRRFMKRDDVTTLTQAPIPRMLGKDLTLLQTLDAVSLLSRPISMFFRRFGNLIPRWNG